VAETGAEHSTSSEIWFADAVTLLAERSGESADYAEQLLVKGLEDDVPWSHMKDGIRVKGDAAFWRHRRVDPLFAIYRAKNSASYVDPTGGGRGGPPRPVDVPASVRDIKVLRTAVLALVSIVAEPETALPSPPVETETAPSSPPVAESETVLSSAAVLPPLPTKEWVAHAIKKCRKELVGLSDRAAANLLEKWGKDGKVGLRKPQKPIGWSRIKAIAVEQGLLPVKLAAGRRRR
jgi:hypothetical protein